MEYKYFAFISYSHKDEAFARWIQRKIEGYRFPVSLLKKHPEIPKKLRPTFRDETELSGGVLNKEIEAGLLSSEWLIVLCSSNSAKSQWVSKEVDFFLQNGREEKTV